MVTRMGASVTLGERTPLSLETMSVHSPFSGALSVMVNLMFFAISAALERNSSALYPGTGPSESTSAALIQASSAAMSLFDL